MELWNVLLITGILLILFLVIYFLMKEDITEDKLLVTQEKYSFTYFLEEIKETINQIQNTNINELNLKKEEAKKREEQKANLYDAVKYCATGDIRYKEYLKEYIEELLQSKYKINEENIEWVLPFSSYSKLTTVDKFDILLYIYKKKYRNKGFSSLCNQFYWDQEKGTSEKLNQQYQSDKYSIDSIDIENAYKAIDSTLSFVEKLEIITQRIYQNYVGHGVIDDLREEISIDGISGGVSGITSYGYEYMEEHIKDEYKNKNRYDSIWVFYKGKPIHMAFMSFLTERELERVVHNLYRNNNMGWLSSRRGFMINDTKDGDRVTCVRPPFSESYGFFIRKFQSMSPQNMETLLPDKNGLQVIDLLKFLVKGCIIMVITGEQNSGKTTLLKSMVQYIDDRYPIRTIEIFFELWLSKLYPNKNIMAFRTLDNIDGSMAISTMKKTDGSVLIAGESADFLTAAKVIELSLVGSKMTLSTNHAMTTKGLIEYHTNAIMSKEIGVYSDDANARSSVVRALNFDIHMIKEPSGKRYIERITEIVPYEELEKEMDESFEENILTGSFEECIKFHIKNQWKKGKYFLIDILKYEDGEYKFLHPLSKRTREKIKLNMNKDDFFQFLQWEEGIKYPKEY